jgi:hypothetical protein
VDERGAREVLVHLEAELLQRAAAAGWRSACIAVLRATARDAGSIHTSSSIRSARPAQIARALADALLGSSS